MGNMNQRIEQTQIPKYSKDMGYNVLAKHPLSTGHTCHEPFFPYRYTCSRGQFRTIGPVNIFKKKGKYLNILSDIAVV
jgi:hypothetical protein